MTLPKKRWKFFSVYPSSLNDELLWLYYYYYKHLWHDYIHHDLKQDLLFYLQIWVNSQVFKSTKITIFEGENRSKMPKKDEPKIRKIYFREVKWPATKQWRDSISEKIHWSCLLNSLYLQTRRFANATNANRNISPQCNHFLVLEFLCVSNVQ